MKCKKIAILFTCALVLCSTFGMAACGKKDQGNSSQKYEKTALTGETPNLIPELSYTKHILVQDGKTDYRIVIPDNASDTMMFAVSELKNRWKEATGGAITSVTENELEFSGASGKYIFLGNSKYKPTSMDLSESNTGSAGYIVKTQDDDVFIGGYADRGALNGVYDFLKCTFNYRYYAPDVWQINDARESTLYLPAFDIANKPEIDMPYMRADGLKGGVNSGRRLRVIGDTSEMFIAINGTNYHTSFGYLAPATYLNPDNSEQYHPEWYMSVANEPDAEIKSVKQICYNAHCKDEDKYSKEGEEPTDYELMLDEMMRVLTKSIVVGQKDPKTLMYAWFTQEDNYEWCGCDACKADIEKYGTPGASIIKTANALGKRLEKWIEEEGVGRRVNLAIYAYMNSMNAPTEVTDDVKLYRNVALYYAPIRSCFVKPFTDPCNKSFADNLDNWMNFTSEAGMMLWAYDQSYFNDYLVPFYGFDTWQANIEYFKSKGMKMYFSQNQYDNPVIPDWGYLKAFLVSQLMWDNSQDIEKLIDDYFNVYFAEAAQSMRQYFDRYCRWYNFAAEKEGFIGAWTIAGKDTMNEKFFPLPELQAWLNYTEAAYKAIESYQKLDATLYQTLCDRICLETITPRYLVTEIHQGSFTGIEWSEMKAELDNDIVRLGILARGEGGGRWY